LKSIHEDHNSDCKKRSMNLESLLDKTFIRQETFDACTS
jgi:hypothetical protein